MIEDSFGPDDFQLATGVSRETLEKFRLYGSLIIEWQQRFNLIGRGTLDSIWHRHFFDSAQLEPLCNSRFSRLVYFGTGAGFPGMVLALMGHSGVELVESNGKKCSFLERVSNSTGTPVVISKLRFDEVSSPDQADIVTARAVAPLYKLLHDVRRWVKPDGVALLHRGGRADLEIQEATKYWQFDVVRHPSLTDPKGVILEISGIRPVDV